MRTLDPQSLPSHVDRLYRAAWALCGSREDAEDLVQETFARVLARPRLVRGEDDLYYLMRALKNTYFTTRRTATRRPVTGAALEDALVADPRPMGRPEKAIEVHELYATIAQLPEDFRLALVAVDVLGLSYREAARALKVREATITTRLFRARRRVARALEPAPAADGAAQDRLPARPARSSGSEQTPGGRPVASRENAQNDRVQREGTRAGGVLEGRRTP
ncbi:MAG TPA: RNA polymerase sigma factor [Solirubrobacteraceae bacterium]|nr:RNA polymerase sigma factor [Solirubrobacteraceae bacterium]